MLPSTFYLGVYLEDILAVYIGVYYSFLLVTGDKNAVHKY